MAYFPERLELISTNNSTTSLLGAGGVFTGTADDVSPYAMMTIFVASDVDSAEKGLSLEFSTDGTNWDRKKTVTVSNADGASVASGGVHTLAVISQYFRVVYTNGSSPQASFRLQTIYHTHKSKALTSNFDQVLSDQTDVELTRTAIMGVDPAGNLRNNPVDTTGRIQINVGEPAGAFGELRTAKLSPQIQLTFPYNINTDLVTSAAVGTEAIVSQANSMAVVTTSGINSSATITSVRTSKYRAGQGSLGRFTGVYTAGVSGCDQLVGIFDDEDGFGFGYNGTSFGVFHRYNSTTDWIASSAFNVDTFDGSGSTLNPSNRTIDPTKGNVFAVTYQYLGFGMIRYYIEDEETGQFSLAHKIKYANNNTIPSLGIPSLPTRLQVVNTTNTSQVSTKTGSMAIFTEGEDKVTGPFNSTSNSKSVSTETNVFTIQNKSTFASKTNKISVYLQYTSVAVDGNNTATFRLTKNATLGGSPSYTDISTNNSVVSVDTAGTTVANGQVIQTIEVAKNSSDSRNLREQEIILYPGETLTFSAASAGTITADVSVTWREDF